MANDGAWRCMMFTDYESGGQEFESLRARQIIFKIQYVQTS